MLATFGVERLFRGEKTNPKNRRLVYPLKFLSTFLASSKACESIALCTWRLQEEGEEEFLEPELIVVD
jgi:hypothetical protein